ncbi:MAG: Gfo/Idh/MocA family oxidoreductase [Planctomycetota bacterium]|nr:Gfo/Idh/MocA family oxidoreductase [Planctomycetota bacterium]
MGAKLKTGMVGVGHFGGYRRARMRETGLFELAAAWDLNPKMLQLCERQDGARPAGSFEELLAMPGLEALVISTGAKFHADQIVAAAERGLHVFVEKPLCSTPGELSLILETQRRTGVVIGVGHNDLRHDPVAQTTKRLIDDGTLGRVATFEKTTAHSGGLKMDPGEWRADPEKNPGGMLFQCGVHGVHELCFYFGPVTHVTSMMRYDVHATRTADVALCHLRFASGLVGTLNAYHVTPYRHTLSIFGTRGNLYRDERHFEEGTKLGLQVTKLDGGYEPIAPVPVEGEADLCGNLRGFHRAIREGGAPYPGLREAAHAVAVVFAAEASAKQGGAPVAVEAFEAVKEFAAAK